MDFSFEFKVTDSLWRPHVKEKALGM